MGHHIMALGFYHMATWSLRDTTTHRDVGFWEPESGLVGLKSVFDGALMLLGLVLPYEAGAA